MRVDVGEGRVDVDDFLSFSDALVVLAGIQVGLGQIVERVQIQWIQLYGVMQLVEDLRRRCGPIWNGESSASRAQSGTMPRCGGAQC